VYETNFYYLNKDGKKVNITGHRIRSALGLRSHAFRTSYDAATDKITITTQGHGHGVGLSQMGAVGFANEDGWSYVQILKYYYSVTDGSNHQVVAPQW
jgi:SpoIID/LytB domain protein